MMLSSGWNQFYPIGERIRDYALLIEQKKNLLSTEEPWMSGTPAHYYLFWYKIGGFLGQIFRLGGEKTYLVLLNFCWTLYFLVIYFFSYRIFKLSICFSAFVGIFILFSSNLAGMVFALNPENRDWWQVSRVIVGAITEFPAWSYLLADLHPHLMNLCLPPLFLYSGFRLLNSSYSYKEKNIGLLVFSILFVSLFLNSNPWDSIAIAAVTGFFLIDFYWKRNSSGNDKILRFLIIGSVFFTFLFLMMKPDMKAIATPRFVMAPVERTPFMSFFQHWGLWIVAITLASAVAFYFKVLKSWFHQYRVIATATLFFWILPEIVYLDDAYGMPNERMNFIFKIYSFTWVFAGLWFISLLSVLPRKIYWGLLLIAMVPSLLFFYKTYRIRIDDLQLASHPLDVADRNYNGVKDAIIKFKELPDGVTVQSASSAYDYTSFIATMSDKKLFLGWANHMSLLSADYGGVLQRVSIINELYAGADCERKIQIMKGIGARYLVLSAQEYKDYPQINPQHFSCLRNLIENSSVKIYSF